MAIAIAAGFMASAARSENLPAIPSGSELQVAAQAMVYARACDIRYKRPAMVWDSKNLFFKYASKTYADPMAVTNQAFNQAQTATTRAYAKATADFTVAFCNRLAQMFKTELKR
ncbi:hypothetical protein [Neorhizobium sp. NCHU2750]|uniref:hypothetical protein n=1 Tax=Neorhizobium sp. NCHU2750 TaxID=1825976 RepID=UPI000E75F6DD